MQQGVVEADSAGGPRPERGGKGAWPTLVILAGVSEPLGELHNDMRWWFSASDHHVQIVLLAKFDENRGALTLEKWEEEAGGQPALRQNIIITQNTTTDPVSYNVIGGELVLGFRRLFLRDPEPGEGDF